MPNWAKLQIQEDLQPFSIITKRDLDKTFEEQTSLHNILLRVKIKNKKVMMDYSIPIDGVKEASSYRQGKGTIQYMLQYLVDHGYIADTDFILGLNDYVILKGEKPVPIFTYAKDLNIPLEKYNILIPDWQNLGSTSYLRNAIQSANALITWQNKKTALFWRGGKYDNTGFRHKLVLLSQSYPEKIDADFVKTYGQEKATNFVTPEEHLNYKYLMSIDGLRASWERFIWHLHSNSFVFKQESSQVQWFYKGVHPYTHYYPIREPDSVLKAIEWSENHPDEVQAMIANSTEFVEDNLSLEDMFHYVIVLLEEYNKRLVKDN